MTLLWGPEYNWEDNIQNEKLWTVYIAIVSYSEHCEWDVCVDIFIMVTIPRLFNQSAQHIHISISVYSKHPSGSCNVGNRMPSQKSACL